MAERTLKDTRLQLHWLAQVLDAFAKRHVEARPHWHHIALRRDHDAWWTWPAPDGTRLGLRFGDATLLLTPRGADAVEMTPAGRTLLDVKGSVEQRLGEAGLAGELTLRDASKMPDHPVAQGAPLTLGGAELGRLDDLYGTAWELLNARRAGFDDAAPVLLWPHHFDVSTLRTLVAGQRDDGEDARTLTLGFSPGDDTYDEPYWYVTPWPYPKGTDLPKLEVGAWHTQGWTGAVLTLSDGGGERERIDAFLDAAVPAGERLVEPAD